jgi:hypothetical protein
MTCLLKVHIIILLAVAGLCADVRGMTGMINFDSDSDSIREMSLSSTGLAIGKQSPAHTLDIGGSIGYSIESVSSNTTIGSNSIVFAGASTGNLSLALSYAGNMNGRAIRVFKTDTSHELSIHAVALATSAGNIQIIGDSAGESKEFIHFTSGNTGFANLMSHSNTWYLLDKSASVSGVAISDDLSRYQLNESSGTVASDYLGNYNGALSGTDFSTSTIAGKEGTGLTFDGVDDKILIGTYNPGTNMTISVWVNRANNNNNQVILGKRDAYGSGTMMWQFGVKNGLLRIQSPTGVVNYSGASVTSGVWVHCVLSVSGSNSYAYINGTLAASSTIAFMASGTTASLIIGANQPTGSGEFYDGSLDDLRIYSRSLNAFEISYLYQSYF